MITFAVTEPHLQVPRLIMSSGPPCSSSVNPYSGGGGGGGGAV